MTDANEIKEKLIEQLYSPVQWEDSVRKMIDLSVDTFIEIGSGKVLSGLIKKINKEVKIYSIQDMESCAQVVQELKA